MIIEAFNGTYFLLLGLIIAVAVIITLLLRKKSEDVRRKVLIGICLLNIFVFIIYKFGLWYGTYGLPDTYEFEIWAELPLHLCNISLMLLPIGLIFRKDFILSYGVYISPLGAILAITFGCPGFTGLNIFYPHMLGFYFTHSVLVLVGILLVILGIFKPSFKKIPSMILLIMVMSFGGFLVSAFLQATISDLAALPNYFYTMSTDGISILDFLWKLIPVRYLYLLPGVAIIGGYACLLTLPFHLRDRARAKKEAATSTLTDNENIDANVY